MMKKIHTSRRRSGGMRVLLAGGALLVVCGVATTAASFTDAALANLGTGIPGSGIGNPHKFDIAVRDADDELQDAATQADAVVLPLVGAATEFTEITPVSFEAVFVNKDDSVVGDLDVSLFDPDGADDLFGRLLFTVYIDGTAVATATNVKADAVNAADLVVENVDPGGEVTVRIDAVIEPGAGAGVAGLSTQLGIAVKGESQ